MRDAVKLQFRRSVSLSPCMAFTAWHWLQVTAALHIRKQSFAATAEPQWNNLYDKLVDYNPSSLLDRLTGDLPAAFSKADKAGFSLQLVVKGATGGAEGPQDVAMQGVMSVIRGMNGKFVKVAAEFSSPYAALPYQVNTDHPL